jgi:hypothetical protein
MDYEQVLLETLTRKANNKWLHIRELFDGGVPLVRELHALWNLEASYEGIQFYTADNDMWVMFSLDDATTTTPEATTSLSSFSSISSPMTRIFSDAINDWVIDGGSMDDCPFKLDARADAVTEDSWLHILVKSCEYDVLTKLLDSDQQCHLYQNLQNKKQQTVLDVAPNRKIANYIAQRIQDCVEQKQHQLRIRLDQIKLQLALIDSSYKDIVQEVDNMSSILKVSEKRCPYYFDTQACSLVVIVCSMATLYYMCM